MLSGCTGDQNHVVTHVIGCVWGMFGFNTLKHEQNGRRFADSIFKCIFVNENVCILIYISLKCVPKDAIDNEYALVQVMAWHRTDSKSFP